MDGWPFASGRRGMNGSQNLSTTIFESVSEDLDETLSGCSSSMPDYLKMAMANHEVGSVLTDVAALQESNHYSPLDQSALNHGCLKLFDQLDQLVRIISDYTAEALQGDATGTEEKLRGIQLRIRPLLEQLDEDIVQLDKRISANLNCCNIREAKVEWLISGHRILEGLRSALSLLTVEVLDCLERLLTLRLRGCEVPSKHQKIENAIRNADEQLNAVSVVLKQKIVGNP